MLFAITCTDKPDSQEIRAATRPAHIAYLDSHVTSIRLAGPMLNEAGQPIGSLLVVEAESPQAAVAFTVADPYTKAHLFANVTIVPFRIGYEGGARV